MYHMVNVLDLLVHVDGHCSDDLTNVGRTLGVVGFHLRVLLQDALGDGL